MHVGNPQGDIGEDLEYLWFCQSVLEPSVHQVDQAAAVAVLHEQKDLKASVLHLGRVRIDVGDDVPPPTQLLHGLDLRPHAGQRLFIRHCHPLEDGGIVSRYGLGQPDHVDMGEASFGQVALDDHSMTAHLDLGSRGKGSSGDLWSREDGVLVRRLPNHGRWIRIEGGGHGHVQGAVGVIEAASGDRTSVRCTLGLRKGVETRSTDSPDDVFGGERVIDVLVAESRIFDMFRAIFA